MNVKNALKNKQTGCKAPKKKKKINTQILQRLKTVVNEKQVIVVDLYWLKKPSCIHKHYVHKK